MSEVLCLALDYFFMIASILLWVQTTDGGVIIRGGVGVGGRHTSASGVGVGVGVGSATGVRRSLPNMATSHLLHEPAKLYPYHLLLITNYRLPPDVDRLNLEVTNLSIVGLTISQHESRPSISAQRACSFVLTFTLSIFIISLYFTRSFNRCLTLCPIYCNM